MELEEKVRKKVKRKLKLDRKRLVDSFGYAFEGIIQAYKGEQNLVIHTFIAILVVVFGFFLKISYVEWLVCLVLIALVIMAEFFNKNSSSCKSSKRHSKCRSTYDGNNICNSRIDNFFTKTN